MTTLALVVATAMVATAMVATAMVATGMLLSPAASATVSTTQLPDLAMAPLRDFRIDTTGGKRLLRFTAEIVNVGMAPFELRGRRPDTTAATMSVKRSTSAPPMR